ncbi:MAG: hypothetical protein ACP5KX_03140 [Caldisericia bacterium]
MNDVITDFKKITIFVGEIGSGKTEFAINYGIKIKTNGNKVEIIDLDLYKPYIRLRDLKEEVEKFGVKVITPPDEIKRADLPLIIHASKSCIYSPDTICIYDIGGGEGASFVLRQFPEIEEFSYDLFYVVNIYRPFTRKKEEIIKNINDIEIATGFTISGIIANSNLREKTKKENIIEGYRVVKEVSDEIGKEIKYIGVREDMISKILDLEFKEIIFPIKNFIKYPGEI